MKTKLKLFAAITALALCCGIFAGCKADGEGGKSSGGGRKTINVYSTGEDYRNENARKMLTEHFPEYDVILTDIGTGNLAAKLAAEGKDTDIDIIMELETSYLVKCSDSLATLDAVDFSPFIEEFVPADKKYSPWLMNSAGIIINKKVLEEKGAAVPASYDDLLKPEYKGLVSMPSPKSSGTGYMFLLNLVNERGEDAAFEYFDKLAENMSGSGFTTSGSGPVKALLQGEAGVGLGITYQAVNEINNGAELEVIYFPEGAPYNTYSAAVIDGREKDADVMTVFNYIINEVSREDKRLYIPEKVFKEQASDMENFPQSIKYGDMTGIDSVETKERLLDKWIH